MLSNRARVALSEIRDNIRLAEEFAAELSVEALRADRRTFYAVTRCLEIISEAARRLPQSLRNRHPELPWRAIMGAGNVKKSSGGPCNTISPSFSKWWRTNSFVPQNEGSSTPNRELCNG
jgi:hypothetical protein